MIESLIQTQALQGMLVLDFSQYLPGPLTSLTLAQAGAQVLKIEPPGGDPMRRLTAAPDGESSLFDLLNMGKRSICIDLKDQACKRFIVDLIPRADVMIEQFRPGVMKRLSLDYETVKELKPDIIYCSISGYGQKGKKALKAGHDLNYQAETGLLGLVSGAGGEPTLPPALFGDIGGGSYPAIINILLAIIARGVTGKGVFLDIAMTDNLWPFLYWSYLGLYRGEKLKTNDELFTGGSPRYQLYQTGDGQWLALAPLEEAFWQRFCELIDLEPQLREWEADPVTCIGRIREILVLKTADEWLSLFSGEDVCCSLVASPSLGHCFSPDSELSRTIVHPQWSAELSPAPALGEANREFGLV